MKRFLFLPTMLIACSAMAQEFPDGAPMKPEMTEFWNPEVTVVTPGVEPAHAPSDAVVLFDGTGESFQQNWTNDKGEKSGWTVADGCVTVTRGTGGITTKAKFEDFQLHIEWRTPAEVVGQSQGRGNSGIFLQGIYEVQVLDNYNNRTYRNGQAGSIYKQSAPLVNVCRKPGEWQVYDIIYTAPRFKPDGSVFSPGRVTVLQNGVLVQNNTTILGPTEYIGVPKYKAHGPGPISLQNHGNPVSYRNIWIRNL